MLIFAAALNDKRWLNLNESPFDVDYNWKGWPEKPLYGCSGYHMAMLFLLMSFSITLIFWILITNISVCESKTSEKIRYTCFVLNESVFLIIWLFRSIFSLTSLINSIILQLVIEIMFIWKMKLNFKKNFSFSHFQGTILNTGPNKE